MDKFEVRDPIHGFIEFTSWERDIINHWAFQRLRRIKQLSWTDMVYPGAMHTRFEHSLGVMHVATKMFDNIVGREDDFLRNDLGFERAGLDRDRILIRIACLLHDVGHSPFSHAGEGLMLKKTENSPNSPAYKHEDYSVAAIRFLFKDVIENHRQNDNYHITAHEIADFIDGNPSLGRRLLWRDLLSGQVDADRADYLLRDSYHCGVSYGHYDLDRLLATMTIGKGETDAPTIAINKGGVHAAEGLIIARYMMFSQVYFHKTRRIYDYHIGQVMNLLLKERLGLTCDKESDKFPPPTSKENIEEYLKWNDWGVLGAIDNNLGGLHGEIIKTRNHYRCVYETNESPIEEDYVKLNAVINKLDKMVGHVDGGYETKMYKMDSDIQIKPLNEECNLAPLSNYSSVVKNLKSIGPNRIYVSNELRGDAQRIIANK